MGQAAAKRIPELKHSLDVAVDFLQGIRETRWAEQLKAVRETMETDAQAGVDGVLRAFEGAHGFDRLYLSGPRNGHNLSERQEIEANGKLHVIRSHLLGVARDIRGASAAA